MIFLALVNASVNDVLTFRGFCNTDGIKYPLAAAHSNDGNLERKEAAFWGLVWIKHTVGAEIIYNEISKLYGASGSTDYDK